MSPWDLEVVGLFEQQHVSCMANHELLTQAAEWELRLLLCPYRVILLMLHVFPNHLQS